ncbi:c-type cytochrome [Aromatoleum toluvorans]|uniref:C-type cytochrome n=1 Tax=Aromatoleum toluvorans TaxID=92002 RepID=A0ABX1Q2C9_9RHOO|nr:cytochrome c [Aromatoleum toluvorans]NMG44660.1 c-type cytochrome [Aromatoleum toluvorans]
MIGRIWLGGFAAALAAASFTAPAFAADAGKDARHEAGRKIYNFRCYFCHGYSGDAKTLAATYLAPKPRDFTKDDEKSISREQMIAAVRDGKPGTAMKGFKGIISERDVETVVDFVRAEFIRAKAVNTRYHTPENGWPNHERNKVAFPFATGAIPLDRPWDQLSPTEKKGKRLFLSTCISCHDHARTEDPGPVWGGRPLSYPRNHFDPGDFNAPPPTKADAIASASPYALHDVVPQVSGLTPGEKRGETLFQANCAFCHGATGTGRNWIGSFMEPHPRDLTDPKFMKDMTRGRLAHTIREGLPNTSMPAWKSVLKDDEIDAIIAYVSRVFHPVKP